MRQVTALEAALLMLVEPVLNPVWRWFVHGEAPGGFAAAGGGVILATTLTRTWVESRSTRPA